MSLISRWGGVPLTPCDVCGERLGVVVMWWTDVEGVEQPTGICCLLCASEHEDE